LLPFAFFLASPLLVKQHSLMYNTFEPDPRHSRAVLPIRISTKMRYGIACNSNGFAGLPESHPLSERPVPNATQKCDTSPRIGSGQGAVRSQTYLNIRRTKETEAHIKKKNATRNNPDSIKTETLNIKYFFQPKRSMKSSPFMRPRKCQPRFGASFTRYMCPKNIGINKIVNTNCL